jgi:hypothetical protein
MVGFGITGAPEVERIGTMRDPDRIPMILAAVERRWRKDPDLRLGQLIGNLVHGHALLLIEDGELLEILGPETENERRYVEEEPEARRKAWEQWPGWRGLN